MTLAAATHGRKKATHGTHESIRRIIEMCTFFLTARYRCYSLSCRNLSPGHYLLNGTLKGGGKWTAVLVCVIDSSVEMLVGQSKSGKMDLTYDATTYLTTAQRSHLNRWQNCGENNG